MHSTYKNGKYVEKTCHTWQYVYNKSTLSGTYSVVRFAVSLHIHTLLPSALRVPVGHGLPLGLVSAYKSTTAYIVY